MKLRVALTALTALLTAFGIGTGIWLMNACAQADWSNLLAPAGFVLGLFAIVGAVAAAIGALYWLWEDKP